MYMYVICPYSIYSVSICIQIEVTVSVILCCVGVRATVTCLSCLGSRTLDPAVPVIPMTAIMRCTLMLVYIHNVCMHPVHSTRT